MRLVSRMSSVLAATALVGTSFTLAVPAIAVEAPVGDEPTVTTEVVKDGSAEEPVSVSPGEEAEDEASQEAPEEQAIATLSDTDAVPTADAVGNPTIAEVRAGADGETVTTEGWVTAAWPTGGLNGFTIQTAGTGGACELDGQSDAIFVYTNHSNNVAPTPAIGSYVTVTGEVATFNGLRQISIGKAAEANDKIKVVADTAGIEPATAISCAWPATEAQRTAIQSMLYDPTSASGFAVTNNYDANTFGSLGISTTGEPLWQPSDVTTDVNERETIAEANKANSFVLDDGATTRFAGGSNTNNKLVPPYVFADGSASVGAKVTFEESLIVDYRNKAWTLNPTTQIETDKTGVLSDLPASFSYTRPAVPSIGSAEDVVVGGFNLENYFPTALGTNWASVCESYNDNTGAPITVKSCSATTSNGVTVAGPRGAWSDAMLEFQTARIVKAINDLDAAALGVMELENSFKMSFGNVAKAGGSAKYLVDALNKASTKGKWAYIEPTSVRQQDVAQQDVMYPGIIYQPGKVTPIANGQLTLRDQSAAGKPFANARAPFGQAFTPNDGGEPFFLVANHFKSKSSAGEGDEADLGEGGWNASRTAQAKALANWANGPALTQLTTNTGVAVKDVVLVGDFNSYTWEAPMRALYDAGFTNVNLNAEGKPIQASYNYSGLNGSLDHVLVSKSTKDRSNGHAIWNINAPEQIGLHYSRYNATGGNFVQDINSVGVPNRASDHDPAVVALKKGGLAAGLKNLTIFNINDFHGRVDGTLNADASAIETPKVGTFDTMQFVYTLEGLRKQMGADNSVFFSAGDNVGATLFASAVQNDQPTIDLLKTLGLQGTAVGNHEFDQGAKDLVERIVPAFGSSSPQPADCGKHLQERWHSATEAICDCGAERPEDRDDGCSNTGNTYVSESQCCRRPRVHGPGRCCQ